MLERKILDLKNQRKIALDNAQTHLDSKDMDKYNAAMKEVGGFNAEIEACENLLNEQKRHPAPQKMNIPSNGGNKDDNDDITLSKVDKARSGKEYFNAFVKAIAHGADVKKDAFRDDYAPLFNALTIGGGTPEGSEGGFLVPIDVDNTIKQFERQFFDLSSLFNNETVTTISGWRVVDEAPTLGMNLVDEMATIPRDDQPKFGKIDYKVKKYGLILPVSNELLSDNAANLMNYLAKWFVKKAIITKRILVLDLLRKLTPKVVTTGKEVEAVKTAINITLDPDIARNSKIITNQSGFNALDLLVDTTGKPLMQPNITNDTEYKIKGKEIIVLKDAFLPNVSGKAPVFIGDYEQYGTVFTRKPFEMASTTIGGNAWATDSTEVRGIIRLDGQVFDEEAATYLQIPID